MAAKLIICQARDPNGDILVGAKLNVYEAGTTTQRSIFTDSALSVASTNPAIADSDGIILVYIDDTAGDAKFVLTNSAESTTYYNQDNFDPTTGPLLIYPLSGDQSLNQADSPTFAGLTMTGNLDMAGNDIILDADNDTEIVVNGDDSLSINVGGTEVLKLDGAAADKLILDGVTFSPTGAAVGQALGYPNSETTLEPYTPAGGGDTLAAAAEAVTGDWSFSGTETYTELKAVSGYAALANGARVNISGRDTVGDGGGGLFLWRTGNQSANVTADAGEGVWVPPSGDATGASGAWQRAAAEFDRLNAKWWGAKGDNSTDDQAALEAASDYAAAQDKALFLPAGFYSIESTWVLEGHGIVIEGELSDVGRASWGDQQTTIIWNGSTSDNMIEIGNSSTSGTTRGGKLRNITINANSTSNVRPWYAYESNSDWLIESVAVRNMSGLGCYNERGCFAWNFIGCFWFNHDQCPGLILTDDCHNNNFYFCRTRGTSITTGTPSAIQIGNAASQNSSNINFWGCDFESENCDVQIDARAVRALTFFGGYQEIPSSTSPDATAFIRLGNTSDSTSAVGVSINGVYFQGGGYVDHVLDIESAEAVAFGEGCHVRNLLDAVVNSSNSCPSSRIDQQFFVENDPSVNGGVTPDQFSAGSDTTGWQEEELSSWGDLRLNKAAANSRIRLLRNDAEVLTFTVDAALNGYITSTNSLVVTLGSGDSIRPVNADSDLGRSADPWRDLYLSGTLTLDGASLTGDSTGKLIVAGDQGREIVLEGSETTNNSVSAYFGFVDNQLNDTKARIGGGRGSNFQNGFLVAETLQSNTMTEVLRIDENGRLLVGKTSGSYLVDVAGDVNVDSNQGYRVNGTYVVQAQGAAVADTAITYTANDPSITPDNAVTIADGSAPTVSELLELSVELKNQIETLKARLEAHGLIAT